jgi:translation initiation factor 4G
MVQVELHKAMNPWVRPRKVEEDLPEEKDLFRKLQGILNKLTPQKFQTLAEQALMLKIDSERLIKGCIEKIFNVVRAYA